MPQLKSAQHTIYACYIGYIVQAIVNNFVPLLFVTFHTSLHISMSQLTMITSLNFIIQLCVDLFSAPFVEKVGTRRAIVIGSLCSGVGFIFLSFLPFILPNPFIGILIAVIFCAIGSGFMEVMVSPIVESCPSENKEAAMSLLHSFYCWGYLGVILVSTLFFAVFGITNWRILAFIWSFVPIFNSIYFLFVPLFPFVDEEQGEISTTNLLKMPVFWLIIVLMICAGASEMGMSQWSSSFMESGLRVPKEIGDLLGPASFAFFMGLSRMYYGKKGENIPLLRFIKICAVLCTFCYLFAGFSPWMILAFISCSLCGFSIGIFWPGTFSMAAKAIPNGGIRMYSYLALAGDIGCTLGTSCVGLFATLFHDNLRSGLGVMIIFPLILLLSISLLQYMQKKA